MLPRLLTLFLLNCLACYAWAQTATITIKGHIIDSAKQTPLSYVTIILNDATGKPIKSSLTKNDGSFQLLNVKPAAYKLNIAYIGYRAISLPVKETLETVDIGKIRMVAAGTQLKEVSVVAAKPIVKQEVDRISYDLQADPESKVQNVLEMMRKVPLLSLDADDNIQLNGSSSYKILINGKPSSLVARSPKDVFRAMPASSIQRIEVITTPPAKYDSEGLAGLINIITNRKVDNGYNGSLNTSYQTPTGGLGLGGSLTVKQGKFGASTYFGQNTFNQPETFSSSSRVTTSDNPSSLIQEGRQRSRNRYGYLGSELSYEIDTLNLLTAEINFNGGKNSSTSFRSSVSTNTLLNLIQQTYNLNNAANGNDGGYDLGLNYQLGFKRNKAQLFTISYKYSSYGSDQLNNLDISNRLGYRDPNYKQFNNENSAEQTIQADYVHPLKKINIEAGLKAILRDNNSDFRYDTLMAGSSDQYNTNLQRSNTYQNYQYVLGAYNTYTYNYKTWSFKGGARLEETIIDADFMSTASQLKRHYLNLIPSISINRRFKDMSSLNFGYTQRIQRPSIWQLNPFVDVSNPNFISTGNPDLIPVVSNNLQLGYSKFKKGSFNLGLNYNFANNTVQSISIYNTANGITTTTYANIGKDRSLGSNFNINYPITKKWNYNLGGNLRYLWIEGIVNNQLAKNSGLQGYFFTSSGYRFEKGWRINGSFSYNSPYITLQGQTNAYYYSSFSVNKDVIKDKLSVSLASNNPFTKYRNYIRETSGLNFIQSSFNQNYFRTFRASINYRFGKLQSQIKKNQRSISNDDKGAKSN
ncbi:MAG: TonB-dependent receptor [Sphingobacteriaceae bacterium]|nr:MAG: TonB-dependent receptor [Sphingobacteriaceae bacterium]